MAKCCFAALVDLEFLLKRCGKYLHTTITRLSPIEISAKNVLIDVSTF